MPITDDRSRSQRDADALVAIARLACAADPSTTRREPPHVLLVATPEQLAEAHVRGRQQEPEVPASFRRPPGTAEASRCGPINPTTLAVLSCDSIVQAVVLDENSGAVLDLGRQQRTASRAQRRALAARDGGCVKCGAPPDRCSAHHVRFWSLGGPTDIANLALLCDHCHLLVHLGTWQILMRDGVPWLKPPPWHHLARPDGEPIRITLHQSARQLRLDLHLGRDPDTG